MNWIPTGTHSQSDHREAHTGSYCGICSLTTCTDISPLRNNKDIFLLLDMFCNIFFVMKHFLCFTCNRLIVDKGRTVIFLLMEYKWVLQMTSSFPEAAAHVACLTDQRCVVALYRTNDALIQVSLHVRQQYVVYCCFCQYLPSTCLSWF